VEPAEHFINWQQDPQGNYSARLVFPKPTKVFSVEVDLVAEMTVFNPFDFFLDPTAEKIPFAYEPKLAVELTPFLRKDAPTPAFEAFISTIDLTPRPRSISSWPSTCGSTARCATSSAWSTACSRRTRRSPSAAARAAIRHGSWSRSSGTSAWRRALSRATSSSCAPT
jgi:transglutaminase-like putative cysteine protease